MLSQYPTFDPLSCQGLDLLHYVLNKSGPMLEIGPGPIYIIGPGPMCHIGLAYNRQVCVRVMGLRVMNIRVMGVRVVGVRVVF